ncbi:substrate-binding periplasmic protein [Colwellia psychrerythraea]|nr:transporter substrate-binding domain-containing protein [Colwellia psychrerythraea]
MKILIYCTLLTLLTPTVLADNKPFYLADDQDFAPYVYIDSEGRKAGIVYDLLVSIFSKMEQDLKYELFPWRRAQKIVSSGLADALVTIPTPNRLVFLVASEPIIRLDFTVHYNNDNPKREQILAINNIKQLQPFQMIDYQGDGWAEENLKQFKVIWAPNYTSAVGMLALNRGDIFLDDNLSIKAHVKKQIQITPKLEQHLLNIKHGDNVLYTVPLCLLIRKDSEYIGLLEQFNKTLHSIKASGEYQQIIDKYVLY